MTEEKKLSIIIPCYNAEEHILTLLQTLVDQYNELLEIILINDGSTDQTAYKLENFIRNHAGKSIYLFSFINRGASKSRTAGLSYAKGQYIAFIDSDDLISDDYVFKLLTATAQNPDLIYYSSIQQKRGETDYNYKISFEENSIIRDSDAFLNSQLKKNYWTAAVWTYIFKRSLAEKSCAAFTDRSAHEDHLFSLSLLAYAKKIVIIKSILYIQLITRGSLTNSKKDISYIHSRYQAYRECRQLIEANFSKQTILTYQYWSLEQCYGIWREIYSLRSLVYNWEFWKMCIRNKDFGQFVLNKILPS